MIDDKYSEWDAAYVLGSLSPVERREYEEHLADCDECSQAVASLAAMPGLLAGLPADEAFTLLDVDQHEEAPLLHAAPEADLLPLLAKRVRRQRRRRLGLTVAGGLAAAAVVAAVVIVPPLVSQPTPTHETSLQQVVPSALSATVAFTTKQWGTRIDMTCHYGGPAAGSGSSSDDTWRYGLYVTDTAGVTTRVSSWTADPGTTAVTTGSIDTALGDIARVEVRNESSGAVLLSRTVS